NQFSSSGGTQQLGLLPLELLVREHLLLMQLAELLELVHHFGGQPARRGRLGLLGRRRLVFLLCLLGVMVLLCGHSGSAERGGAPAALTSVSSQWHLESSLNGLSCNDRAGEGAAHHQVRVIPPSA